MKTLIALIVILVSGVLFSLYETNKECAAKNGTLVKGIFWYECVEAKLKEKNT